MPSYITLLAHSAALVAAPAFAQTQLAPIVVQERAPQAGTLSLDAEAPTATGLGLRLRDTPLSISVIQQADIRERGLRTALEATNTAVGVAGGILPGSIPRYSMRGFTDNNVTLLRDGIRQNTMAQSSRPVDAFMLDRIEVLKGPASIMFGEGAVGGVINYVSRLPSFRPTIDSYALYGSYGDRRLGVSVGGPLGASAPGAIPTWASQATFGVIDSAGYVDRNRQQQYSGSAALRFQPSARFASSLHLDYSQENLQSWFGAPVIYDAAINSITGVRTVGVANTATDSLENPRLSLANRRTNYNFADSTTDASNFFGRWVTEAALVRRWSLRNTLYHSTHEVHWRNSENYVWNPATQRVQRDLFHIVRDDSLIGNRAELVWGGRLGVPVRFVAGVDWSRNSLERGTRPGGALPNLNVTLDAPIVGNAPAAFANPVRQASAFIETVAPFAEVLIEPTPSLKLIGGLRRDWIEVRRIDRLTPANSTNQDYAPNTGRVGAVWIASPSLNVYASYTTAAEPVQQFVSLTNAQAQLSLQRGRQAEIGLKQTAFARRLDWTFAVYDIVKTDLLSTTLVGGTQTPQTIGEQASRGAEFEIAMQPHPRARVGFNAAYTRAEFGSFSEVSGASTFDRTGKTPPNVPKWIANLFFTVRVVDNVYLIGLARHVGERFANNANTIRLDSFTTYDLGAEYRMRRLTVGVRGRNLADKVYADWAINFGLQQRIGDPRTFEGYVRYAF